MQGAEAELFKALYVACIAVGGFIFALLLSHQHRGRPGNKTLAAFMLFIQVPTLSAYSQLTFGQVPFALQAASQCLILIYGPIIYLLLKAILKPERPVKCAYLHFVPFITIFLLKFLIIPDYGLYVWIPFATLIWVYLLVNIRLLITSREQFFQLHSGYKNTTFYWFSFVVGGISVLTVYDIIIISLYLNGIYLGFKWWNIMTFSLCGYLTIVSAFSIWRPTIFYNVLKKKVKSQKKLNGSAYLLANSAIKPLELTVHHVLKDNELYKDNELTLSKLADATGVSSHMLSELLNVHMQTNFYELVNRYRLECAIGMLQVEATSSSIIDIALSAGFNNKNTFYRVFKEKVGVTPSAYRSRNRKMAS